MPPWLALAALGGCLAPPAVVAVSPIDGDAAFARLPAGAERVAIEVSPGEALRGFFVPVEPDHEAAPVVLHLLEAGASVAHGQADRERAFRRLADLGLASLALDWSGVGLSDGERSVDHLPRDALSMWNEAVRRAGSPERVLVRATSLGTLAAAALLERGIEPGAVVFLAPVMGDTAVERFGKEVYGSVAAFLARLVFRDVSTGNVPAALAKYPGPLLVVTSSADFFLDSDELAAIVSGATARGGELVDTGVGHVLTALGARTLLGREVAFWSAFGEPPAAERLARVLDALSADERARFDDTAARARLEHLCRRASHAPPQTLAAASLANADVVVAARGLWALESSLPAGLTLEEQIQALSLADPAGDLPVTWIERLLEPSVLIGAFGGRFSLGPEVVRDSARAIVDSGPEEEATFTWSVEVNGVREQAVVDLRALADELRESSTDPAGVERRLVRTYLKGLGHVERLRGGVVEVFDDGAWTPLAPAEDGAPAPQAE